MLSDASFTCKECDKFFFMKSLRNTKMPHGISVDRVSSLSSVVGNFRTQITIFEHNFRDNLIRI